MGDWEVAFPPLAEAISQFRYESDVDRWAKVDIRSSSQGTDDRLVRITITSSGQSFARPTRAGDPVRVEWEPRSPEGESDEEEDEEAGSEASGPHTDIGTSPKRDREDDEPDSGQPPTKRPTSNTGEERVQAPDEAKE